MRWPNLVIDRFEVIEIDEEQGCICAVECLDELVEPAAVRQSGERVLQRRSSQRPVGSVAPYGVGDESDLLSLIDGEVPRPSGRGGVRDERHQDAFGVTVDIDPGDGARVETVRFGRETQQWR